jgi:DNA-binding MarR family transcriptional regulator
MVAMPLTAPATSCGEIPVHPVPTVLARRFAQICVAAIAEAIEGSGLTPLQYAVMRFLNYEGPIYQNGVAGRLGIDQSNASLLVEQLVSAGLIEQRVDGADRRARLLKLTPAGNRLVRKVRPQTQAANERLLLPLDLSERRLFVDLLVRIVEGNRALDRPGAGRRKRRSPKESVTEAVSNRRR